MKLKRHTRRKTYGPLVLYKNDLDNLYNIINLTDCSIIVSSEKYDFENWNDFMNSSIQSFSKLNIKVRDNSRILIIEIDIDKRTSGIDCEPFMKSVIDRETLSDVYIDLDNLLSELAIKNRFFSNPIFVNIISVFIVILNIFFAIYLRFYLSFLISLLPTLLLIIFYLSQPESKVFTTPKNKNLTFWQRKKDDLVVNLIVAIVSSVLTYLITKLTS